MNRSTAVVAGLLAAAVIGAGATASQAYGEPASAQRSDPLPSQRHCPFDETVTACVWDARHMGDGLGQSYWSDGQRAHYYRHGIVHRLAYGHWQRAPARMVGKRVDLVHGNRSRVIRARDRVDFGNTTLIVFAGHPGKVGTS